jgi:hypothetical protein
MTNKGFVRVAALVLLFVGVTAGAYAQIIISGGFALSSMRAKVLGLDAAQSGYAGTYDGDVGLGGSVSLDYLLPVRVSLGMELGVHGSSFSVDGMKDKMTAIPILFRVGYHFDVTPNLDLYLVGKLGGAFGSWKGDNRDYFEAEGASVGTIGGFGFGFDVGLAYFTSNIGVFIEGGLDRYNLKTDIDATIPVSYYSSQKITAKIEVPFNHFLTFGLSFKF